MNIEQGAMQKALVLAGSVLAKGGDTSRGVPTPVSTPVPTLLSPGVNHRKDLGNQEGGAGDSFDSLGASRVWGVPTPVPGVSTVPTGLIDALGGWLGKSEILAELGKADTATRQLSDKEREQRRAAAKARWAKYRGQAATAGMAPVRIGGDEGRQLPGGPGRRMTSSLYGQYRAHKDAEFADVKPEGGRAGFKTFGFQPQRPKGMSEESYTQLATAAGRTVKGLREQIAAKAQERRLIPEGTTSRDYRAALSHAQRLALHDVGLGSYDFRMEDEAKGRMKPLEPFIRYARRRTYSALRDEHKGTWQQFKAEFGQEFADRRVDLEGNVRRRFYPHMELVRSEPSDLLSSEGSDLGKRVLTDKEREQRRAAAKARWGNQPRSDYSPKRQLLMQRYGMTESVANAVGGRFSGKSRL